jgi:hypothetical protein
MVPTMALPVVFRGRKHVFTCQSVVGSGSWFEQSADVVGPPAGDGGRTPLADGYVLAEVMRYWGRFSGERVLRAPD